MKSKRRKGHRIADEQSKLKQQGKDEFIAAAAILHTGNSRMIFTAQAIFAKFARLLLRSHLSFVAHHLLSDGLLESVDILEQFG